MRELFVSGGGSWYADILVTGDGYGETSFTELFVVVLSDDGNELGIYG
jgi:hypothetical protein